MGNKSKKPGILVVAGLALSFFFSFVSSAFAGPSGKLKVTATIFVLYDFCRQVGGDKIALSMLLEPAVEAHSFEPGPRDILSISSCDLFVYAGDVMEPWVLGMLAGIANKSLLVVDASQGISLIRGEEGHAGHDQADHHGADPHIWLDLGNAQRMVDTIAASFTLRDPANKKFFENRAREYKAQLAALDARFKSELSCCRLTTFIYAGHFAFGYFARRYGLHHLSPYRGFSPDAEPSPRALAELIKKTRQLGVRYIYYEELIDPKIARTIASETGTGILLLASAHNLGKEDFEKGVDFIGIMKNNLEKLKMGLECR